MRFFNKRKLIVLISILMIIFLSACHGQVEDILDKEIKGEEQAQASFEGQVESEDERKDSIGIENLALEEIIEVHYIDVGQGDSVFIKQGQHSMLIDGGENIYGEFLVDYLQANGVEKLDYLIGTHPHSDHIGGLDDVINSFEIGKVIMPKVTHATKTFEDVILAIKNKGLKITTPIVGQDYDLGQAIFTIIGPGKSTYSNLNDYSVITRLEFGDNSFIFTGDAEEEAEMEAVNSGLKLKSDVLKVGHHGSVTSTIKEFLKAVNPSIAVIQLGLDNNYGHPHTEVLERLEESNIEVYRNDLDGTVIVRSDGEKITISTENGSQETFSQDGEAEVAENQEDDDNQENLEYIGNKNSKIFHRTTCKSLPAEKNRIIFNSKEEAIKAGHKACQSCKP